MELLRNNEELIMCPYNKSHHIRRGRFEMHLIKCRAAYEQRDEKVISVCDFNSAHRVPEPELRYHHQSCQDRKTFELQVYDPEELLDPVIPIQQPAIPPLVDDSWDCEETESYNPQLYVEQNEIVRRLDSKSAAQKRDFRINERQRFNALLEKQRMDNASGSNPSTSTNGNAASAVQRKTKLPPTPAFSTGPDQRRDDIAAAMVGMAIKPKAGAIPKRK